MANIRGNGNNNFLNGNYTVDSIWGYGGNDFIMGWGSADTIYGGNGKDTIFGDFNFDDGYTPNNPQANDKLYGGSHKDIIVGGEGADQIYGGSGSDHIWGSEGYDEMWGGSGNDNFYFIVDSNHHAHNAHLGYDQIMDYNPGDDLIFSMDVNNSQIYDFGDDVFIGTVNSYVLIHNAEVSDVKNSIIDNVSFDDAWYGMSQSMWVYG